MKKTEFQVCPFCDSDVYRIGEDAIDMCPQCGCIEGQKRKYINEDGEEINI